MGNYIRYVVFKGRKPGIYSSLQKMQAQIKNYPNPMFKGYHSLREAADAFKRTRNHSGNVKKNTKECNGEPQEILCPKEFIIVDGAYSCKTGISSFQGLKMPSHERIIHSGNYYDGSNNLAEFLAIAHALYYCKANNIKLPIYSDSKVAIGWIKKKKAKTWQKETPRNLSLLKEVEDAEKWLDENVYLNEIMKWETWKWGENPADFGNKKK